MADNITSQESTVPKSNDGVDIAQLLLHGIDLKALGLDISDIESIEIGTAKGTKSEILHDVANHLQTEMNNAETAPDDESLTNICTKTTKKEEEHNLQNEPINSGNSKTRKLEDLVMEFKSSLKNSDWLEENTVEKMQQKNPELIAQVMEMKEKQRNGEEIEIPEDFQIISTDLGPTEDNELTSLMTTLYHQIKSSNWLEEQNKSLSTLSESTKDETESVGACAAVPNTTSTGAFEVMMQELQSVPGQSDDISDMMSELQHSIRTSSPDFLKLHNTDSSSPKK